MSDIEHFVITSDVIKSFDCTEKSLIAAKEHIRVRGGVFHVDATGPVVYKVGQKTGKILYYGLFPKTSGAYTENLVTLPVLELLLEPIKA